MGVILENVLITGIRNSIFAASSEADFRGVNLTVQGAQLIDTITANLILTNTLIVDTYVTTGSYWGISTIETGYLDQFQIVGGGRFYLAEGSSFRDAGNNQISAELLDVLARSTTDPPKLIDGAINAGERVNWHQRARRDSDQPDLGYHYPPIDYFVNDVDVHGILTIDAGTSVTTHGNRHIEVFEDGVVMINGTAAAPVRLTRSCTQQESWMGLPLIDYYQHSYLLYSHPGATISGRFLYGVNNCPYGGFAYILRHRWENPDANLDFQDCRFIGGSLVTDGSDLHLLNCLLDGANLYLGSDEGETAFSAKHCLFRNGAISGVNDNSSSVWSFHDSLLDNVAVSLSGAGPYSSGNNGLYQSGTLPNSSGGDVTLASLDFTKGPLGSVIGVSIPVPGLETRGNSLFPPVTSNSPTESSTVPGRFPPLSERAYITASWKPMERRT